MNLRQLPGWSLVALGMLSACATHEHKGQKPTGPVATPAPRAWDFEEEWARAGVESAPGSAGQAWERSSNPTVESAYGAVIDDCATPHDSSDPGATSDQRFVLDIAGSGMVRQVWSEHDSPLLSCARESLGRTRFAPPPTDGYRMGLLLDLGDPESPQRIERLPRPAPGSITSYEAMRMAVTDMATQEGQPYMQQFHAKVPEVFLPGFVKCMNIPLLENEQSLRGYGLILEIAADGTAQRVLVEPVPQAPVAEQFRSPRADCLHDALSTATLATPPWDGFWVYMGLDNPPSGFPTELR
jgi:hypothetical protein